MFQFDFNSPATTNPKMPATRAADERRVQDVHPAVRKPGRGLSAAAHVRVVAACGRHVLGELGGRAPQHQDDQDPMKHARGAVISALLTMNAVKKNPAMAGAMWVIACIVAPSRRSHPLELGLHDGRRRGRPHRFVAEQDAN